MPSEMKLEEGFYWFKWDKETARDVWPLWPLHSEEIWNWHIMFVSSNGLVCLMGVEGVLSSKETEIALSRMIVGPKLERP